MKILVTGTSRGLGNFLYQSLQCESFTRNDSVLSLKNKYDLIVHCAFNSQNVVSQESLFSYIEDNIFLTKNLISNVQSDKFLFISSIDVYPDNIEKIEDLPINIDNIRNIYGKCKLICEEIVKKHPNHLILRPCSLIGKNKMPRSVTNLFATKHITLTKDSVLNYINQTVILNIIKEFNNNDKASNQTINLASDNSFYINEFETIVPDIKYGNYNYNVGNISTNKFKKYFPNIQIKSSKETLFDLIKQK